MTISIRELARIAGVSHTTVSYALRGDPRVHPQTRDHIQALAKEHRCHSNLMAKGFFEGRSYAIGVIVPNVAFEFFPPMIRGIEEVVFDQGYTLVVGSSLNSVQKERQLVDRFLGHRIDGLVIASVYEEADVSHFAEIQKSGVPMVVVDRRLERIETDFVGSDDYGGAMQAVEHLLAMGHRHIGHITGPRGVSSMGRRTAGFLETMESHGINVSQRYVVHARIEDDAPDIDLVREPLMQLLASDPRPTALFVSSDQYAFGAYAFLREQGLRVPEDISIVGFADLHSARCLTPRLTTVRQDPEDMGRRAAAIVLKRLAEKEAGETQPRFYTEVLPVQLKVRESVFVT